jgi:hypothetical protein
MPMAFSKESLSILAEVHLPVQKEKLKDLSFDCRGPLLFSCCWSVSPVIRRGK